MNEFSVIEVNDARWSEVIAKCNTFDFYHTKCYHQIENESHRAVLCVAYVGDDCLALPVLIRKIPDTNFFDCTSVYGYCGPIATKDFKELPNELFLFFQKELLQFFKNNKVVSAFSRLHPLIESETFFNNLGKVKNLNKTVAIDLRLSLEDQRKQYRKSNKPEISKLRRIGFEVVEAKTNEEIDAFIAIYLETMDRVNASSSYFFDKEYFYNFLANSCFQAKLLLATFDNKIVAGAIFTITNKIMQYHLAGTAQGFITHTPMKLILDEARLLGNKLNLDFLHLGGGVGGSDEDSLFRFKSGFSKLRCQYQIWQLIIDNEKYDELVAIKNTDKNSEFFPLYRV